MYLRREQVVGIFRFIDLKQVGWEHDFSIEQDPD